MSEYLWGSRLKYFAQRLTVVHSLASGGFFVVGRSVGHPWFCIPRLFVTADPGGGNPRDRFGCDATVW